MDGRRARLLALLLVAIALVAGTAFALDGSSDDPPPPPDGATSPVSMGTAPLEQAKPTPVVRFTVGRGVRSAAIVRRAGARGPQPTVIFLHGWGITAPDAYARWIRHLAALGNTVIAPRYQRSAQDDPGLVRGRALAGIRSALRRAPVRERTLVVAGHSAGAALAADYAAVASSQGLPPPVAVFAVYPGRAIRGYPGGIAEADPARIPADVHLTALAGAADSVVGEQPARSLVARAVRVPETRRRILRVIDPRAADHLAPTRSTASARAAFWRPLDRLIERARGG